MSPEMNQGPANQIPWDRIGLGLLLAAGILFFLAYLGYPPIAYHFPTWFLQSSYSYRGGGSYARFGSAVCFLGALYIAGGIISNRK